jgi:hypothetical protein
MSEPYGEAIRYCLAASEVRYVRASGWRPGPVPRRSRPTIHRPQGILHAFDTQLDAPVCGTEGALHIFMGASWGGMLGQGTLCPDCLAFFVGL